MRLLLAEDEKILSEALVEMRGFEPVSNIGITEVQIRGSEILTNFSEDLVA